MINAGNLLGQLLGSGMSNSGQDRMGHAMGPQGLGRQGNPLASIFGGGQSGGGAGGQVAGGGGLGDILGGLIGGATGAVKRGDPMAIGGLGALAGAVLSGGSMRGAVQGGGLALIGTLAMSALRDWGKGGEAPSNPDELAQQAPLGVRPPHNAAEEEELQHNALVILKGMINAAKADGNIDEDEMQRIVGHLNRNGVTDEERAFLESEINKPLDLQGLISQINSPELAAQVYTASLLAIDVDTTAEEEYLRQLAQGLGLSPQTVGNIHDFLGVK